MNRVQRSIALLVVVGLAGYLIQRQSRADTKEGAGKGAWLSSYDKALEKAKADKKLVIADFAGSDWCPPCKALWSTVLSQQEFVDAQSSRAVLVEVDFPHQKPQDADEKKRNEELAEQFKIEGFPTVMVLDSTGKELGRVVGFDGKADWNKELAGILAKAK